jgi:Ca2+-binding RTX toxin-like protein
LPYDRERLNDAIDLLEGATPMSRSALVVFSLAVLALALPATAVGAAPTCNDKKATNPGSLVGTSGDDVIIGTSGDDTINGLGGNDTICGLGGSDLISGGNDDDVLFGGDGGDGLDQTNNAGNDVIYGGDGNDGMGNGGSLDFGDDTYDGGAGDDVIRDSNGKSVAHGGPGADRIEVNGRAYGDAGNDPHVSASETSSGADDGFASGGSGSDGGDSCSSSAVRVFGGTADGGSGNDLVCIFGVGDTAKGGSGSDVVDGIAAGATDQLLDCGAGFDTYRADGSDTVLRCEQTTA